MRFRAGIRAICVLAACACGSERPGPPVPKVVCAEELDGLSEPAGTMLRDPGAPFELPPLQETVELYRLEIAPENLEALATNPRADTMYEATFERDGIRYPALVRYRGNSSRDWPKKSWRVEFPDDRGFDGRHKLNLLSQWKDCTMMVEKLAYDLLAALHVPAPHATFVRLEINGEYQGVYLDLERVDKKFLAAHAFPDDDGTIYRCGRKDCEMKLWRAEFQRAWEKKTNEREDDSRLEQLLCAINAAPEHRFDEVLDQTLELELYLRYLVVDALISNNVVEDSRSYLVHDDRNRRWLYVPWDFNNSSTRYQPGSRVGTKAKVDHPLFPFSVTDSWSEDAYQQRLVEDTSRDWHPLFSNLNTRIAFHPALRERFFLLLEQAMATVLTPEALGPRIDAIHALLSPYIPGDVNVDPEKFDDGPRYLKDYAERRAAFLEGEIHRYGEREPAVELYRVDPASGRITVRNRGSTAVPLEGWTLTTDLRRRPAPNLSGVIEAGAELVLDLVELGLESTVPGEFGLFRGPALDDVVDVLFPGLLEADESWIRSADDPLRWELAR